jgi:hypothetical protein
MAARKPMHVIFEKSISAFIAKMQSLPIAARKMAKCRGRRAGMAASHSRRIDFQSSIGVTLYYFHFYGERSIPDTRISARLEQLPLS